jgi:hypothetical protein
MHYLLSVTKRFCNRMMIKMLKLLSRPLHFGRDSRNRDYMDIGKLTIHGTGCPFPDGQDDELMDLAETAC